MLRIGPRLFVGLLLCLAVPLAAEEPAMMFGAPVDIRAGDPPIDVYGLGLNTSVIQVSQWQEVQSGVTWAHPLPGYLNLTASTFNPALYAPIELEQGSQLTQVCVRAFDNSNTDAVVLLVAAFEAAADGAGAPQFVPLEGVTTGVAAVPLYTQLCAAVDPVVTIRTSADINADGSTNTVQYFVGVSLPAGAATAVGPAVLTWRRSVSPAPAFATFTDVPVGHALHRFVEALAASGITGGCGGGQYCPDLPLTRGQMAVFLSAALGLYWPN